MLSGAALLSARIRATHISDAILQTAFLVLVLALHQANRAVIHRETLAPTQENERIQAVGCIDSEPIWNGVRGSFVLKTDSLCQRGRWEVSKKRLLVLTKRTREISSRSRIHLGQRWRITASVEPFPRPRNPGEFDYGRVLELNEISGILRTSPADTVTLLGAATARGWELSVARMQQGLYAVFDSLHPSAHASFLKGVVLGFREEIAPDIKQSFMDTGTIHILAVSGSNVAVVALALGAVLGFARLNRRLLMLATFAGLLLYMLVTGSSASVVRATVMAMLVLGGGVIERKTDIYNTLGMAAVGLLLWNTANLFDVGFQLSFAAVWALVYFYPKLESLIARIPERFEEIKAIDAVLKLAAVSLAAQIGTVPFTAYYFNRISLVSIVANLVVVPVSGLNTLVGFAEAVTFLISADVARCFAAVNDVLVWFLLGFVREASQVPFAYFDAQGMSAAGTLVYYAAAIGAFGITQPYVVKRALTAILLGLLIFVFEPLASARRDGLAVTFLDVGQGDAVLLRTPANHTLLVDTGPAVGSMDAGSRTIVPFLRRQGVSRLDALVLTHAHDDHIGGALSVIRGCPVAAVYLPRSDMKTKGFDAIVREAESRKILIDSIGTGRIVPLDPAMRVYVLAPSASMRKGRNLNEESIVMKVVYGQTALLLTGDAENRVEQALVGAYELFLRSGILKAAHHGSKTSSSSEWLRRVSPRLAVVSVGRNNRFGHPSGETLGRMHSLGIPVLRTDREGAVLLQSDGVSWGRVNWR